MWCRLTLIIGDNAEAVRGQLLDPLLVSVGELLMRLARRLAVRGPGTAPLHLLAVEKIIEVHTISPAQ